MSRTEFWSLTIRELFQEFVIAKRCARETFNAAMTQTWYGAVLPNQKRIKPLKAYLLRDEAALVQSPSQMRSMLHVLASQFGGRVVKETAT